MAKILAIDDEPDFLVGLKEILRREGHEMETAPDGATGLRKAREARPALILLDISMPGMNGLEVLKELSFSKETSQIPVVMLTARGEADSLMRAKDLQAVDYLIKPFSVDELLKVIRSYVL